MPGRNSSDNKFFSSPFLVGPVLGDGCNYSTVQSAIDDCFAAGGGEVYIKPGTYTENLVLRSGVNLRAEQVDGRLPPFLGHVVISGNHTFTQAGGFAVCIMNDISLTCTVGDLVTLTATAGAQIIFACKFSGLDATTDPASRAIVFNPDAISACQFSTDNTNIGSSSHCFEAIGAGSSAALLSLGSCNSASGDVFLLTAGSGSLSVENGNASSSSYVFNGVVANGNATFSHTDIFSGNEAVFFPAGGGQCVASHCTISSAAASGNWIDGAGGQVDFVDIALTGTAQGIGAALTSQKLNWQPYGESAAAAVGSNRGTASFNSTDFSVSDGFVSISGSTSGPITQLNGDTGNATPVAGVVQILGGPGVTTNGAGAAMTISSVEWIDVALPGVLNVDTGYFDVGPNTYTLPAAPTQGEQFRIFSINSPTVVQANVGQTIQVGSLTSSGGGTATGTNTGDCLVLVFYAAGTRWCAESIVGNWVLA